MSQDQLDVDALEESMDKQFTRVPNLFILDRSASMDGKRINKLNDGLDRFVKEVAGDREAEWSIDVSIVSFGSDVTVEQEFMQIDEAWMDSDNNPDAPDLQAGGSTPMMDAIIKGIEHLEEYKDYVDNELGSGRKRALVWLLTDGEPDHGHKPGTDKWNTAQELIKAGTHGDEDENPHMFFFAAAVSEDANKDTLDKLVEMGNDDMVHSFNLKENMFDELFEVASASAKDSATGTESESKEDVLNEEVLDEEDSE
jgi:uncharacterized protein YegL